MTSDSKFDTYAVSTHSRAEAAAERGLSVISSLLFQHTAARRRLPDFQRYVSLDYMVSTHSRAEAAALYARPAIIKRCFNTQPRGGGCRVAS